MTRFCELREVMRKPNVSSKASVCGRKSDGRLGTWRAKRAVVLPTGYLDGIKTDTSAKDRVSDVCIFSISNTEILDY